MSVLRRFPKFHRNFGDPDSLGSTLCLEKFHKNFGDQDSLESTLCRMVEPYFFAIRYEYFGFCLVFVFRKLQKLRDCSAIITENREIFSALSFNFK